MQVVFLSFSLSEKIQFLFLHARTAFLQKKDSKIALSHNTYIKIYSFLALAMLYLQFEKAFYELFISSLPCVFLKYKVYTKKYKESGELSYKKV
jgi:hypothetical protein